MSKILLFCGAIFSIISSTLQTDYCTICENKSHTMCKYQKGPSDKCIGYLSNKITPVIQNLIVELHNEMRNKVASGREIGKKCRSLPPGANMNALKWDQELATIAQRWADQCVSISEPNQHDECKTTDRFAVGQNVIQAIRISPIIDFKHFVVGMVKRWYKEVEKVNPTSIARFKNFTNWNAHNGNFAQIVWAKTKYIGCAHTSFAVNSTTYGVGILDRLVCNYGPSGNIVGNPIYKAGLPCLDCGYCSKKYPALCDDNFPRNIRKKRQNNPSIEPSTNNSNIYKTDEAEFGLNHHLTQKLFQLFEKLNLTINNNLLMQLNDIHNKYNISSEVQDISNHVREPPSVAYIDELEFRNQINNTFEWEIPKMMNKNKSVSVRQQTRKKLYKIILCNKIKHFDLGKPTGETTNLTLKLIQVLNRVQQQLPTTSSDQVGSLMYPGGKCFCNFKDLSTQK